MQLPIAGLTPFSDSRQVAEQICLSASSIIRYQTIDANCVQLGR